MLKILIENGASVLPDLEGNNEPTAYSLIAAIKANSFEAVEILIKAGAPVNHYDLLRQSIHWAILLLSTMPWKIVVGWR